MHDIHERIIKELIKKDYNIPLSKLDKIVYIMHKNGCTSVKDWDEINSYLKKYTEKTNERHSLWTFETSIDLYYEYLKEFDKTSAPLKPREDMYNLIWNMKRLKSEKEEQSFEEERHMAFQIHDEYSRNFMEEFYLKN